jgi:hypothetical protein
MNQSGYADLLNTSIIDATSIVIGTLILPDLDPKSVPYIDSNNTVQDRVVNNGQLLIGSTGNDPVASSINGTTDEVIVTNGPGSITLSLPQPIAPTSDPTFPDITANTLSINHLNFPNLDQNSVPYIDSSNNVSDLVLNDGQLVIGSTGLAPTKSTLTGTTDQVIVTNGPGSITLSLPQSIATTSDISINHINGKIGNDLVTGPPPSVGLDNLAAFNHTGGPFLPLAGGTMNASSTINSNSGNITNLTNLNGNPVSNLVTNSGSSTSGNLVQFSGTSGKVINDSSLSSSNIVLNTGGTVTSGQLAVFSGTSGRLITASGTLPGSYLPLAGGTMSGGINMNTQSLTNVSGQTFTGTSPSGTGVIVDFGTGFTRGNYLQVDEILVSFKVALCSYAIMQISIELLISLFIIQMIQQL